MHGLILNYIDNFRWFWLSPTGKKIFERVHLDHLDWKKSIGILRMVNPSVNTIPNDFRTKMAWYSDNPRPKNGSFMTSLGMKPRSIVAYLARSAHSTLTILWFLSNVGTCRMDRWIQMDCWSKVAGDHWVWLFDCFVLSSHLCFNWRSRFHLLARSKMLPLWEANPSAAAAKFIKNLCSTTRIVVAHNLSKSWLNRRVFP